MRRHCAFSRPTIMMVGIAFLLSAFLVSELLLFSLFNLSGVRDYRLFEFMLAVLRAVLFNLGILTILYGRRGEGETARTILRKPGIVRQILFYTGAFLLFTAIRLALPGIGGFAVLPAAGLLAAAAILTAKGVLVLVARSFGSARRFSLFSNLLLLCISVAVVLIGAEGILRAMQHRSVVEDSDSRVISKLVMPAELARRETTVEGAAAAFTWMGKLHVFNRDGMRQRGDFPAKDPRYFRILAVGDSLTYGYGVAREEAYPNLLEEALQKKYYAEVLNLGIAAAQSTELLEVVEKFVPLLDPDLVFYGVCLNDFLPRGRGQYDNNYVWQAPLPYKAQLAEETLIGALLAERYNSLLMKLGVRADFFTDILRDFQGYQRRFEDDVARMNLFVRSRNLPPIAAMVLTQFPSTSGKGYEIGKTAERILREAGFRVIPSEGYIAASDGRKDLVVSRWEGHPNQEAHRIFAAEILKEIEQSPELGRYRR